MKKYLVALVVLVGLGTTSMAQSKIAHVNTQRLMDTVPSREIAANQYKQYEDAALAELKEMEDDFNKALADYEMKAKDMIPAMREIEEKKLYEKQQRIELRKQSLNDELMKVSNELQVPIMDRIQRAINIVSERKKLNYVLDVSYIVYFNGGVDITDEVAVELLKLDAAETSTPQ